MPDNALVPELGEVMGNLVLIYGYYGNLADIKESQHFLKRKLDVSFIYLFDQDLLNLFLLDACKKTDQFPLK